MDKVLTATLTHCRHGNALAVLESEPFNGLAATPDQLLALAQSLIRIAHAAVEHNSARRVLPAKRITLEIENV